MKIYHEGFEFKDLLLVPRVAGINHREEVDLSSTLPNGIRLEIPIIASPMKGIISKELVVELARLGGIGLLHRFYNSNIEMVADMDYVRSRIDNWGASIGIGGDDEVIKAAIALDMGAKIICVDVANGYTSNLLKTVETLGSLIEKKEYDACVMAGNVVTPDGVKALLNAGAQLIRVGIGSGGLCTTRNKTGIGVPQMTAIDLCTDIGGMIVSDGGIEESGDAVKALAAGAHFVMIGSLFGKTYESAHNGVIYGMASRKLQDEYHHGVKSVEGMEKKLAKTISLEDFITDFVWGMKSGMAYIAKNLAELRKEAVFVTVGNGSIKNL